MFTENIYSTVVDNNNKKKDSKKRNFADFFKKKGKTEKKPKIKKENSSGGKKAMIRIIVAVFVTLTAIGGFVTYKKYEEKQSLQVTPEDIEGFKKKTVSKAKEQKAQPEKKQDKRTINIQQPQETKKKVIVKIPDDIEETVAKTTKKEVKIEKTQNEPTKAELKRLLATSMLKKNVSFFLEDKGIKLSIDGETIQEGDEVFENFTLGKVKVINDDTDISNAKIQFTITKDGKKINNIVLKFKDAYKIYFYYEAVEVEPKGNPSLRTKMMFSGGEIKKDFYFDYFEDNGDYVLFEFTLMGKHFYKKLNSEDLD